MTPANLLYREAVSGRKRYASWMDIVKDLNLDLIFRSMGREDAYITETARTVVMTPLQSPEEVLYRQAVVRDLAAHPELAEELYQCGLRQKKAMLLHREECETQRVRGGSRSGLIIEQLRYLEQAMRERIALRELLRAHRGTFQSQALQALSDGLLGEPMEEILQKIEDLNFYVEGGDSGYHFQFGGGMKIREARLIYCHNVNHDRGQKKDSRMKKFLNRYISKNSIPITTTEIRQDAERLKESALLQSLEIFKSYRESLMEFYGSFAEEIAFYMGVIRFQKRMEELRFPLAFPRPLAQGTTTVEFAGLYELTMGIYTQKVPVGNSLRADPAKIVFVTGANQGGKSTFLRSYGIAQILMQCGMPVPAEAFAAPLYSQIFTHFTRREDEQLNSGRLQEELKRVSRMIDQAGPGSLFLLNESFASTTEKEGSKIADGLLRAFYDTGITTFMVTHLFQLARKLSEEAPAGLVSLVAERKEDGTRTFHMVPGAPSHTSYGIELFESMIKNS